MAGLRILDVAIEMVADVMVLVRLLEGKDRDLSRQLKRAAMSVAAQIGEGDEARKGNKPARLQSALAEAREVKVHLRLAVACRYLSLKEVSVAMDRADHCCAVLWKLTR